MQSSHKQTIEPPLALPEELLLQVEKPERYIGREVHAVLKEKTQELIRFAMCFPDVYEIGMSHLGMQILYGMFNAREDVWCERVFSPWPDLEQILRKSNLPLFALESQEPLSAFDFLGFTLQYEMCYTNILQVLDLSDIPFHSVDRQRSDPFVIGGGPCTYNPEPLAPFFDMFYIGEGEVSYDALFSLYHSWHGSGESRQSFLRQAAQIPGIYVPSLYRATYAEDGQLASFLPLFPDVPKRVRKQLVVDPDMVYYPEHPVVPYLQATQDRAVLEIMRGCMRGCRFCQAGFVYRPLREKDPGHLREQASRLLRQTGYDELSLSSLSSSDYSGLAPLLSALLQDCQQSHTNISLPSLRVDAFSLDVMQKVQDLRKSSLTFAPEAGTQRLRDVINKGLTEEEILRGCGEAFAGGWSKVKLYFMLGLPTETEADADGIATLCQQIAEVYYDIPKEERIKKQMGKVSITASSSFFVPKPFTPFQWAAMATEEAYRNQVRRVKEAVRSQKNQKSIRYTYHHSGISMLEGILARGDRRVAAVLEDVYRRGARFDAWSEYFDAARWEEAFAAQNIEPSFYVHRERSQSEILPWDFIDIGVSRAFLWKEWERARQGRVTPPCRETCSACGMQSFLSGEEVTTCPAGPWNLKRNASAR